MSRVDVIEIRKVTYDVYLKGDLTNYQAQKVTEKCMSDQKSEVSTTIDVIELSQEKIDSLSMEVIDTHLLGEEEVTI